VEIRVVPSKNSTLLIVPSASDAVAVSVMDPVEQITALLAGAVRLTVGGILPPVTGMVPEMVYSPKQA
jgi:hypothetical protein